MLGRKTTTLLAWVTSDLSHNVNRATYKVKADFSALMKTKKPSHGKKLTEGCLHEWSRKQEGREGFSNWLGNNNNNIVRPKVSDRLKLRYEQLFKDYTLSDTIMNWWVKLSSMLKFYRTKVECFEKLNYLQCYQMSTRNWMILFLCFVKATL